MKAEEFKHHTNIYCQTVGVKTLFSDTKQIEYPVGKLMVSGYFDDYYNNPPVLACAMQKPEQEWLEILVHETCHMDQWLNNKPLWNKQYYDGTAADTIVSEWLSGKDFSKDDYTKATRIMQEIEIDCEKRTAKKMHYYDLPIDPQAYIKNANSYLFFYSVILIERKWCETAPYQVPEILEIMPEKFVDDYTQIPKHFLELCRKYVF